MESVVNLTDNHSIRLQKFLSEVGLMSRRAADRLIIEGKVRVNGSVATPGIRIQPEKDRILIDNQPVGGTTAPKVYWMLYKPDLTLCSRSTSEGMPTIYQLPALSKVPFHFSSIGRLDFRSEGLLLLTNDGELVQRLTHPRYQVERTYQVLVSGKLDKEQLRSIRSGLTLDDGPVEVKKITYVHGKNLGKSRGSWYFVTVAEGRNRLIRRLFERFDCKVIRLIRISYGQLQLPEGLRPGEIRSLRSEQIKMLKKVGEESKR